MTDLTRFATWREIHAQPVIWRDWAGALDVAALRDWVAEQRIEEIWFCGAGSSAYIGEMVVAALEGGPGQRLRAVATTELVARPHAYLNGRRVLVVNFGRSGNSTETIGTLDALDALAPDAPRLNITCNAASALATRKSAHQRVIVLPDATHDAGFAMTSSFSTMLLTALAIFDLAVPAQETKGRLETVSDDLASALPAFVAFAKAARRPERVVFVGSGPLAFAAREAALKVMELAAGQIPALWDSTLGFRHGPKSFVRDATDIWVFGSADPDAARYDADLVAELRAQFPGSIITFAGPDGGLALPTQGWGIILPVVLAQVLAVVWSDGLGLPVDDPFAGQGTLSRVVSGVTLYPVVAK
jgi:tagatose-6-phosphate ketose/aldose isomerase